MWVAVNILPTHIQIFAMKCIFLVCRMYAFGAMLLQDTLFGYHHHLRGLQNNICNSLLISGDVHSSFWSTQIRRYNHYSTK